MNWYRVVVYVTTDENKYKADEILEYIATSRTAAWYLWFKLQRMCGMHVEVFRKDGTKCNMEDGVNGI